MNADKAAQVRAAAEAITAKLTQDASEKEPKSPAIIQLRPPMPQTVKVMEPSAKPLFSAVKVAEPPAKPLFSAVKLAGLPAKPLFSAVKLAGLPAKPLFS